MRQNGSLAGGYTWRRCSPRSSRFNLAVGETSVILLHPPLPLLGVSIGMGRGCQQNDSLADGYL